jgi:hypothetical protein
MDRLSCVRAFTRLFDALATPENGVSKEEGEAYPALIEMWFLFCMIWGIGGPLDEDGRKKFDAFMREMDTRFVVRSFGSSCRYVYKAPNFMFDHKVAGYGSAKDMVQPSCIIIPVITIIIIINIIIMLRPRRSGVKLKVAHLIG